LSILKTSLVAETIEPTVALTLQEDGEGNIILVGTSEDGEQASLLTIDSEGVVVLHAGIPYALGFNLDADGRLLAFREDVS